ncbi:MAG: TIGR03862 family flavoprotein [Verrucomicrobiales bacterium]|nr:TIGR03862 family flavoprotein [Verrucomicrobiales bacterium]
MKTSGNIAVVGGGPAGLRAAEVAAAAGAQVTVYDAMRSVGRKFLVAGKSGLNLTNGEDWESFLARYSGSEFPATLWRQILSDFDNEALRQWASNLGIETFVASSGKVFPVPISGTIKAAPLLRRWVERLRALGVTFQTGHHWAGFDSAGNLSFQHGAEMIRLQHDATILALGGASWPQTGSTGTWAEILESTGIGVTPLSSANCGWEVNWPKELLAEAEGLPLKNLKLFAGDVSRRGEMVITGYGLEGGPVYHLGPALRALPDPALIVDFKPDLTVEELTERLGPVKRNFVREAGRRWKLDPAACALLKYLPDRGPWKSAEQLAREVKRCRIPLTGPRPIAEAISSAGGVRWNELNEGLMLKKIPGVFIAGEMIDWDAPTGGYLMQGCFATGTWAGKSALGWVNRSVSI